MAKLPVLGVTRQERGWAGHYVLAMRCLFRRNTLLCCENGVRIVVSTIGNLAPTDAWDQIERISGVHYFETMAFHADTSEFRDADVSQKVSFDASWRIKEPGEEIAADLMHEAVVAEITRKLAEGGSFPPDANDEV